MQDLIGSVRRSLAFKPSGEETSGLGGFVEKIGSSIRKSRIGLFNKPPVHSLPPIPKAETPPSRKLMKEEYPIPMMKDEALPPMEEAMEEEALLKMKKEREAPSRERGDYWKNSSSGVVSGVGSAQDSMADQDGARVSYHAHGSWVRVSPPPPSPMITMFPFQRPQSMSIAGPSWSNVTSVYEEKMQDEPQIPTMITWTHGGREVYVVGSWDNWRKRKRMRRTGKEFVVMRKIPSGVYHYRFIVDGQWRYVPDIPWELDRAGNVCNILDSKDYVPDATESRASFEQPQSPDSSYNNAYLGPEDFEKDPPMVPPHLEHTLLNAPAPHMEIPPPLSKPQHGVLDHLYIQKDMSTPSVVALGSTSRFQAKYVTVVLYKSTQTRG